MLTSSDEETTMTVEYYKKRRNALEAQYSPWQLRTLSQVLDHGAERFADRVVLQTDDKSFTYAEMAAWSERIAAGLLELGIGPGEHVALVMANHPEFVAVKFAIAKVGAVCVPVNFLLRERELTYVLQQSNAVALITMDSFRQSDYVAMLDSMMPGWEQAGGGPNFPDLRHVVVFSAEGTCRSWKSLGDLETVPTLETRARLGEIEAGFDVGRTCDILYTSGTTGNPKGVLLTHDMIVRSGYASAFGRGLVPGHRITYSLPMYHVFGYIECLLAAMFAGATVVPHLAFDPAEILSSVARHQVNEIACVPTMTLALIAEASRATEKRQPYDLSSVTVMYSSGGPAPASIWDDIHAVFAPVEVVHGYGQTETTAAMTAAISTTPHTGEEDHEVRQSNGKFRAAGAAGDPTLGGVLAVYKAVDVETGADLPRGERGELVVRGPAVTAGYYNKAEETAEAITADGWLRTGDIGIVDADDRVYLVGRLKETYRCGGEMVMPKEIENLLAQHSGVSQVHVVGIPHPRMGEVGCAVIVPTGPDRPSSASLIELCMKNLARFKVPAHIVYLASADLPLTVTGRVQKFRLVEMVVERLRASGEI
jgi:fatty-acyl-CoA synthase